MSNEELRNLLTVLALIISISSFALTYRSTQHARQIAVRQLRNQLEAEVDLATAALDAVSTQAEALQVEYRDLIVRYPMATQEPRLEGIEGKLSDLRTLVDKQREDAEKMKGRIQVISISADAKTAEKNLTELLGSIRSTAIMAAGKAWDADLRAIERGIDAILKRSEITTV
jgi:hypothetical protein